MGLATCAYTAQNNIIKNFLCKQIIDPKVTIFDEKCPHIVLQADLRPKTSVELLWIAPPSGVGCIEFRYFGCIYAQITLL